MAHLRIRATHALPHGGIFIKHVVFPLASHEYSLCQSLRTQATRLGGTHILGNGQEQIRPASNLTNPNTRISTRDDTSKREIKRHATDGSAKTTVQAKEAALRAALLRQLAEAESKAEAKKSSQQEYQRRYNTAARKWVSTMIALPILLVTSYYLFDRRKFPLSQGPEPVTDMPRGADQTKSSSQLLWETCQKRCHRKLHMIASQTEKTIPDIPGT
jgi:hypothetical protein